MKRFRFLVFHLFIFWRFTFSTLPASELSTLFSLIIRSFAWLLSFIASLYQPPSMMFCELLSIDPQVAPLALQFFSSRRLLLWILVSGFWNAVVCAGLNALSSGAFQCSVTTIFDSCVVQRFVRFRVLKAQLFSTDGQNLQIRDFLTYILNSCGSSLFD